MHVGLSRPSAPRPPVADIDAAVIGHLAEQAGFESVFLGEHAITPLAEAAASSVYADGVPFNQDAMVGLSRLSAATSSIRFGFGVCLIVQHNPVRLAKQLACLDHYSGGRLICGIGIGWSRHETEALGGRFERRWGQAREAVGLMRALWTQDRVEHDGEFFAVPPIRCFPQPAQKPGPPILMGSHGGQSFQRIADYADGWMPGIVGDDAIVAGPAMIRDGIVRIRTLAAQVGRRFDDVPVTVVLRGTVNRDVLRRYEDAGVERVAVSMPMATTAGEAEKAIGEMADTLLA